MRALNGVLARAGQVRNCEPQDLEKAKTELKRWQQQVKEKAPPRSDFRGKAINFSYTDAKKIRKYLLGKCDYQDRRRDDVELLLAVKCFGYHGGICSVWVYFGVLGRVKGADE